jgi:hypothetical protein
VTVVLCSSVLLAALLSFFLLQTRPVYLVDFSCYKPPDRCAHSSGAVQQQQKQQHAMMREPSNMQDQTPPDLTPEISICVQSTRLLTLGVYLCSKRAVAQPDSQSMQDCDHHSFLQCLQPDLHLTFSIYGLVG